MNPVYFWAFTGEWPVTLSSESSAVIIVIAFLIVIIIGILSYFCKK